MRIKSILAKPFAKRIQKQNYKWAKNPVYYQEKLFKKLVRQADQTIFGKEHNFHSITNYKEFQTSVPVRDYEELKPYIDQILEGKKDVLWPGLPLYFAKTSGTTSGAKYIPLTQESMPFHIKAARDALLMYIAQTGNASFLEGKLIFLQGSPIIDTKQKIKTGRLSGIVAHYVPSYLQKNRMPTWETNCIEDWESKVNAIVDETLPEDMRLISGIPSWVQMYFEKLREKTGKKIADIFPNFNLFVYGGVNYEPYRNKFEQLIGKKVDSIELFPASEGFFAFQDIQDQTGMLLLVNHGIFYEFIPADQFYDPNPPRLTIGEVQLGVNYVMILSTNAGLWAYNLGDTVQFTSLFPHRVIVSGRIKHFISAFGEHVIAKEIEHALQETISESTISVNEFTVAPQINPTKGLPYHEWFIEFDQKPENMDNFITKIDTALQSQNSYYFDLIQGKVLQPLKVRVVKKGGFQAYMKSVGKLGGQNKVPRLSNDRKIADRLQDYVE
ncbi:GH3 auxin-responsive promoter family protein [Flavobacteriaceae bacterium F08102]|nr:GH3 auxin-responsive promoter family protein [Flavobacteriaceae bacterium F08102]